MNTLKTKNIDRKDGRLAIDLNMIQNEAVKITEGIPEWLEIGRGGRQRCAYRGRDK